jgi:hypothetical protein
MSFESFLGDPTEAERWRADADDIWESIATGRSDTDQRLGGNQLAATWLKHEDTECVLRVLGGEWGVYGVGARYFRNERIGTESATELVAPTILVDHLWLVRDLQALGAATPFAYVWQAEWARDRLQDLLHREIPPHVVLEASLPPRPFQVAAGALAWSPHGGTGGGPGPDGTLGPRARFGGTDGYLTAGHVAPIDVANNRAYAVVNISDGTAVVSGVVERAELPVPITAGVGGSKVPGGFDVSFVTFPGHAGLGLGAAGSAGPADAVTKTGQATQLTQGLIANYQLWVGGPNGVWKSCYGIVTDIDDPVLGAQSFAEAGDSGSAVQMGGQVVGLVVGGTKSIYGCPRTVTYAHDAEKIETELGYTLVP